MIQLPTGIAKIIASVTNFGIKHGPKIMSVCGAGMAVGGAVMACNATLKADAVLTEHKHQMELIEAAREVRDKIASDRVHKNEMTEYSDDDIKRDKLMVYMHTAKQLAKLYGPAIAIGLGGVGLMQGAFGIMDKRHSVTTASLAALQESYNALAEKSMKGLPEGEDKKVLLPWDEEELPKNIKKNAPKNDAGDLIFSGGYIPISEFEKIENDPFTIVFDSNNPNWYGNNGYLLNSGFASGTINTFELHRSSYSKPQVWVNDVRRSFDVEEMAIGWRTGWTANVPGDCVEAEIIPYVYDKDDMDNIIGMYPVDGDTLDERLDNFRMLETEGEDLGDYCLLIMLRGSSPIGQPRMIAQEVFG